MVNKKRYSFSGRIYELLLSDEKFVTEISKLRKVENTFPKYDQWKDSAGFHISFALAGYTPDDITVKVYGRQIFIESSGLDRITDVESIEVDLKEKPLDEEQSANKNAKTSLSKGYIARGIARRSFKTNLFISEEFDLSSVKVNMQHGLLHICVPEVVVEERNIKINE